MPPPPTTVPPCTTAMGTLLPWWSKLVHRVLVAEASGRKEAGDERTDRGLAAGPPGLRVRAAVEHGPGAPSSRVRPEAVRPPPARGRAGWAPEAIEVIDEDQARTATTTDGRSGVARLATAVAHGEVGAVFPLEVSRMARSSGDWRRLLRLCGVAAWPWWTSSASTTPATTTTSSSWNSRGRCRKRRSIGCGCACTGRASTRPGAAL